MSDTCVAASRCGSADDSVRAPSDLLRCPTSLPQAVGPISAACEGCLCLLHHLLGKRALPWTMRKWRSNNGERKQAISIEKVKY